MTAAEAITAAPVETVLRAAVYARKSKYNGKTYSKGRSVREQLDAGRADCDRNGWDVVHEFVDDDRSASRREDGRTQAEREEFEDLIEWIHSGRLNVVVCWESSRLNRDLAVYVRLRDACWTSGVLWCYGGRTYDLSNADDRLKTGLDALIGEREVDQLRERVKRSVRANALAGRPHGPIPYGYRAVYDETTKALREVVIIPEQARIVREIFQRVAAGESPYNIASDFNKRGVPARSQKWTKSRVRRAVQRLLGDPDYEVGAEAKRRYEAAETFLEIARDFNSREVPCLTAAWGFMAVRDIAINPAYLGKRVHRGEVVADAVWPPIVKENTAARCRAYLLDPSKKGAKGALRTHWLTGIARCGVCGTPVKVIGERGGKNYVCNARAHNGVKGFHVARREERVDQYVEACLFEWLSRPDFADAFTDDVDAARMREAAAQAETLRVRLDEHYAEAAAGRLTARGLAVVEAQLLVEIDAAEKQVQALRIPTVARDLVALQPEQVAMAWKNLSLHQRRRVAESLMKITILPAGIGSRAPIHQTVRVELRNADVA